MLHADVLASTRPDRVTVGCLGRRWELALRTATQWIGAIGYDPDGLVGIFPGGVTDDDLDALWECSQQESSDGHNGMVRTQLARLDDQDIERRWLNSARVAVTRGSGRDWWWSVNLTMRCLRMWPYVNGLLLLRGVDAAKMPFASWLDAAFMLLWERQDEEGRIKLDLELSMPPAGLRGKAASRANRKMMEGFAAD